MEEKIKKADDLMRRGESSRAVGVIKDALKEEPEGPYLHYLLGIARMKCGRFFLSREALEKANQLLPRHSENLRSLGWVKVMLGQIGEGRNDLREAISLDLMNPLAYIDLAMSYFHCCDFKEGMEWLERGRALAPKDSFVLDNLKTARETEKEYLRFSASKRQKMREEKLNPKAQLALRISILESYSFKKPLTQDEAEEIREEARLNGLSVSIVSEEDQGKIIDSKNKNASLRMKEILKRRDEIAKKLSKILEEINSPFTLEHIKDIIYYEKDSDDLTKVVSMFNKGKSIEEANQTLKIINDAWNYFPHKSLNGLCPMEKILESQRIKKSNPSSKNPVSLRGK